MDKTLLILIIFFSFFGLAQDRIFSCGNNGEIVEFNQFDCSIRSLGVYNVYGDIAITNDGEIYGISDRIYKIDTLTQSETAVSGQLIFGIGGLGLLALDNNTLLYDKYDSLFTYDLIGQQESFLGVVGYNVNGDFTLLNEIIYMVSADNELIRIKLNSSWTSIDSIQNIGVMNTFSLSAYSIFSVYNSCASMEKGLYVIDEDIVYYLDESDAHVEYFCDFENQHFSFGSASIFNKVYENEKLIIPNVFTPNNDGFNDLFLINSLQEFSYFQIEIRNRWGNLLFRSNDPNFTWDGRLTTGVIVSTGVYYYSLSYENSCQEHIEINGFITLTR